MVVARLVHQVDQDDDAAAELVDACGTDPGWLCERTFEWSDGNEALTGVVDWIVGRPLKILFILLVAWIAARIARRMLDKAITKFMHPRDNLAQRQLQRLGIDNPDVLLSDVLGVDQADPQMRARREARATSIAAVVGSTASVLIWTIAVLLVLSEIDIDLGPLIAGAGIAGVALGFGAQSLVQDCIAGFFMLLEDQFGIGDVVDLGEAGGVVEEVGLRATVLRGLDGTVWHVANGQIQRVGNKSQLWSAALVDIDVAYDADLERVRDVLLATAEAVCEDPEWADDVLEPPDLLGVETLGADGITMRMLVKTAPGMQWTIQRALRLALKRALDDADIEIPFPQRTVWLRSEQT